VSSAARRTGRGVSRPVRATRRSATRLVAAAAIAGLLAGALACSGASVAGDDTGLEPLVGQWRGVLLSRGGDLPFALRVDPEGSEPAAVVINAGVENRVETVTRQGAASYTLQFAGAQSELVVKMAPTGDALSGYWRHEYGDAVSVPPGRQRTTQMPFSASKNDRRRFQRNDPALDVAPPEGVAVLPDVGGTWHVTSESAALGSEVGELIQDLEQVTGTLVGAPAPLEGIYRDGLLRLSLFDGQNAVLLHGRATPDGALEGVVWLAGQDEVPWVAQRR